MKFGEKFEQLSVPLPQWKPYNVDYNNLKTLIKIATTDKSTRAIGIPGSLSDDDSVEGPEKDVEDALIEEHERVELYCKSKYGEIQRRLEHQSRQLDKLNSIRSAKANEKREARLAKIEREIIAAGNALQLLSRFVGANRQAFRKLLKKFQKWGGSSRLVERFQSQHLDRAEFIASAASPLSGLLSEFTILSENVRKPFDVKGKGLPENSTSAKQIAKELQIGFTHGTQADFDARFAATESAPDSGRAIYWVHQDNLVEIQVLMQTVTNQRRASTADVPTNANKVSTSPLNTFGEEWSGSGMIVCDDIESCKNGKIVAPATVYYTTSDKAVTLQLQDERLNLRRKEVALLLQTDYTLPNTQDAADFNRARDWLAERKEIQPLSEVGYTRTRYAGFSNTTSEGIWATLDNDLVMAKIEETPHVSNFPYAVLDIRWVGKANPELVKNLDRNVLAERVSGFDLRSHAIAKTWPDVPKPKWFELIGTDLRKATVVVGSEGNAKTNSSDSATSERPGTSHSQYTGPSSSTSINEIPGLSEPYRKQRLARLKNKLHIGAPLEEPPQEVYWNEWDHGSEADEAERYFVELNADDEDILASMFAAFGQKAKAIAEKLTFKKHRSPEQRPLLSPTDSTSSTDSEMLLSRDAAHGRTYSTFANHQVFQPMASVQERIVQQRDRILFWATWISFAISVVFLAVSVVIETVPRKKYSGESRVFSVFGVLMSFILAALGLTCGMLRDERVRLLQPAIIVMSFVVLTVADGVLMVSIWSGAG